jgi:hypothetical protein
MGKHASNGKVDAKPRFDVGLIAPPAYDPPDFHSLVSKKLTALLGTKSLTHQIGLHSVWAQPISHAAGRAAKPRGWHDSGMPVNRFDGKRSWLRTYMMIAAGADALIVFGPLTPEMEIVLELCPKMGCNVRRIEVSKEIAGK